MVEEVEGAIKETETDKGVSEVTVKKEEVVLEEIEKKAEEDSEETETRIVETEEEEVAIGEIGEIEEGEGIGITKVEDDKMKEMQMSKKRRTRK